jgi:hypothetical protein
VPEWYYFGAAVTQLFDIWADRQVIVWFLSDALWVAGQQTGPFRLKTAQNPSSLTLVFALC